MSDVNVDRQERSGADEQTGISTFRPSGHQAQNISELERSGSILGGAALLLAGLKRGKLGGLMMGIMGGSLLYRGIKGHCHCYEALGIDTSEHGPATAVPAGQGAKVEKTITVNRSPEELYAYWRDIENLPRVMRHLERVEALDANRSRWVAKGPLGKSVEWEAEVYREREPELIAWRSLPDSEVETAGSVHFKSLGHDRGTSVAVSMKYNPPAGKVGVTVAWLLGSGLEQELQEDLRRFKNAMEAGEVPTTDGQPHG